MFWFIRCVSGCAVNRKQFLQLAALALSHLSLNRWAWAETPQEHILVIGAGMAGLSAATHLQQRGYRITVLEGRSRLGGRIWTDTSLGLPLDLGAAWIHGIHKNPIKALADQLNVKTVPTDLDAGAFYEPNGRRLSQAEFNHMNNLYDEFAETLDDLELPNADDSTSLETAIHTVLKRMKLTPLEAQGVNWLITSYIQMEYACPSGDLSWEYWNTDDDFHGPHVIFPQGYHQLIAGLAQSLDIHLNQVVSHIDYDDRQVRVTTSQRVWQADRVVVTLPLAVLQQDYVVFSPTLPKRKQQALQRLKMGTMNKIALRFPQAFWPANAYWMGCLDSANTTTLEVWNMVPYTQQPVLVALTREPHSKLLEMVSEKEAIASAMDDYRRMFGTQIPDPIAGKVTHWHNDPFAGGSYSHIPPGASSDDFNALSAPIGQRVFFAGEATIADYFGTVHGAFISGQRAATRLRKSHL